MKAVRVLKTEGEKRKERKTKSWDTKLAQRPTEKSDSVLTRVFPESAFSLHVQLNASAAVCTLKIPNTGSHTTVWTTKILHTLIGMGSAAFAHTDRNG